VCGNGQCENAWLDAGESCGNCPMDCGPCQPINSFSTCAAQQQVALTFDDGPTFVAPQLMDQLLTAGLPATFFLLGNNINVNPDILTEQVNNGFSTLGHTHTHPDLTLLSTQQIAGEMLLMETAFANAGVCRKPTLILPPYGKINSVGRALLRKMGYRAVVRCRAHLCVILDSRSRSRAPS
jgi:peptidoglycan/xylan/chitin deacetylase (PgdA/CDA1 family)